MKSQSPVYDCFNQQSNPRGHYYSTRLLHARGVWVGYRDPNKQKKSYLGHPSYRQLIRNFHNISLPFPPLGSRTTAASLTIMPLDGDDEMGMFCILLRQPLDRSMSTLHTWRPYELLHSGDGKNFANNFMLFTLRNADQHADTREVVRGALDPLELYRLRAKVISQQDTELLPMTKIVRTTGNKSNQLPQGRSVSPKRKSCRFEDVNSDLESLGENRKKRREQKRAKTTPATPRMKTKSVCHSVAKSANPESHLLHPISLSSSTVQGSPLVLGGSALMRASSASMNDEYTQKVYIATSASPEPHTEHPGSLSSSTMPGSSLVQGGSTPTSAPSFSLTEEQTQKVQIIWTFNHNGYSYELVRTMAECMSFSGLLEELRGEVQLLNPVAEHFEKTRLWRLAYTLPDGTKKAVLARKGTETAYGRLQTTLALSPIWTRDSDGTVDIELSAMD
ncbi:hypothetical protein GQ44DRAFT_691847 [Phaeosphaeriaceae sp. PMI808]|nr:hypothetical protein GQ44DRAFT_691847 [Phaeosphaeriaceae sp. PMI808]